MATQPSELRVGLVFVVMPAVRRLRTHPWEKTAVRPVKPLCLASTLLSVRCLVGKTEVEITERDVFVRKMAETQGAFKAHSMSLVEVASEVRLEDGQRVV